MAAIDIKEKMCRILGPAYMGNGELRCIIIAGVWDIVENTLMAQVYMPVDQEARNESSRLKNKSD